MEKLTEIVMDEKAICPKCKHYNAMLAEWDARQGKWIVKCRDCGYKAIPVEKTK